MLKWSLISNHGMVLATIAKHPHSTAREIGDIVGITERSAHKIINNLEEASYLTKRKVGRNNKYRINAHVQLQDEFTDSVVGDLLVVLGWKKRGKKGNLVKVEN